MLTGCITYQHPATGEDALAAQKKLAVVPSGYLAMTATFDLASFFGLPQIELDVQPVGGGDVVHLQVGAAEIEAFGPRVAEIPLIFVLPAGRYEVVKSQIRIPGGRMGRREYSDMTQILNLERHYQPFTVDADRLTHIGITYFSLTESHSGHTLFYQTRTNTWLSRPKAATWAPYRALIGRVPATFSHKLKNGTVEWAPFTNGKDAL